MMEIRKAAERGKAEHGWLSSRHTFSFANYRNAQQNGFSDLLVINDDRVAPGKGFGTHGHRDMEIFSYVLNGTLAHSDSMGNGAQIQPGDVQLMSAGSGVTHSEFNGSLELPVHFLQIWIVPDRVGGKPVYQQRRFSEADKRGQLRLVISPDGREGSLRIQQDASVYAGLFDGAESATLALDGERHAYVHVARGSVELNGIRLDAGDGVRLRNAPSLTLTKGEAAEVLVFDLRAHELPQMP
ncbi:MAG: pirin family protein [Burkholderiaceae bacterium]|jgi:redox-sensitive bicupin YhaK (pirin superfamily)|nr:pirin family protein [Burkholderiaceae bacterium]MCO5105042.1 pirin family protein [Burkholderiaceae bacterium]